MKSINKIFIIMFVIFMLMVFSTGYAIGKRNAPIHYVKEYVKDTIYVDTSKVVIDTIYRPANLDTTIKPYTATDTTKIRTRGFDMGTLIVKYTYRPKNSFAYIWDIRPIYKDKYIIDTLTISNNSCIMRTKDFAFGTAIGIITTIGILTYFIVR